MRLFRHTVARRPTPALRRLRAQGGLTLIELMLTVVILAIIASLAVPAYQNTIHEARIHTAIKEIQQIAVILDDRYADNDPPATLAAAGVSLVDPWGNPYRYLWLRGNPSSKIKGKRRRDKSMNPVNTDYDLYSMGEDGKTSAQFVAKKARDDVVRADDGDFIGIAEDH